VLGGSTTFGEGVLREEDTWVKLLERHLRARLGLRTDVINGGVSGYNIIENMLHYLLLLQKLDPDIVVLVTGINDVDPRLIGKLRSDYSNSRIVWNGEPPANAHPSALLSWSRLYRLLIWRQINGGRLGHIYAYVQRPYPNVAEWGEMLNRNTSAEYERYLRMFVRMLRAESRMVVIVPQPWISRPGHQGDKYFGIGVGEHNSVAARISVDMGVPFVRDAIDPSIFGAQLFWDSAHFNENGSRVMARFMENWLCAHANLIHGKDCAEDWGPR
jgi:lysophospholipase L1-like esterase